MTGAEKDTLGCLGYTFRLQWPLTIQCKVLSCYWKMYLSQNRIYMFPTLPLINICWTARTAHQKSRLRSVSPGKRYVVLQMGERNQQAIGLPVLHTAGACCIFVQFLVLLTSVSFCQHHTPPQSPTLLPSNKSTHSSQVHLWARCGYTAASAQFNYNNQVRGHFGDLVIKRKKTKPQMILSCG